MKVKRKVNVARIVWVVCLFLLLIIILLMVMDYKINYQYLVHNHLYFYECEDELCVSEVKDESKLLLSTYDCGYEVCPEYKKKISEDTVLLHNEGKSILYFYRENKIISDEYDDYEFIDGKYIIVKKRNLYGIIDIDNKVAVKVSYDDIGIHVNGYLTGYNADVIVVKKNNLYGTVSYKDGKVVDEIKYEEGNLENLIATLKND